MNRAERRARGHRGAGVGTWWNGQPTPARRVVVVVGYGDPAEEHRESKWWWKHAGSERHAVEVTYAGRVFFLDDRKGSGWKKVTVGYGHPKLSTWSLPDDSVVVRERGDDG